MAVPYLTVYTKEPSGMGRGDYTTFHPDHGEIKFIQQSLTEGDRMVFTMWLDDREQELDSKRPIRFYTDDGTKLFDGQIIDTKYIEVGNNYKVLEVTANGWWQELATMDLKNPVEYVATDTPNEIFADLVRRANDSGVMKEAIYAYDTERIPGYNEHTAAYTTATGTSISFSNVYQGMQEMTRYMDVAENSSTYEFGLRIETLPRVAVDCNEAITSNDVSGSNPSIYILPFILDMDKTSALTYNKFQLASGYTVRRDYRRLANDVVAVGDGVVTQQIRTTQILTQKDVSTNDQWWARDEQALASHYLRVTLENTTAVDAYGYIQIVRFDGATNPVETFPMYVPAYGTQIQYTSERTDQGLPSGNCIRAESFMGCKITVDEVTNDASPYNTTIAGASINDYGLHSHRIDELWLNTQTRVDYAAGKHCRLYHAPMHVFDGEVLQRYIEYTNLIGRTVDAYSPFVLGVEGFLITDVLYSFKDTKIEQRLKGYRHEYAWDYDDTNIYVVYNPSLEHVITSTGEFVVI
jgi:hypothetical protein